MWRRTTEPKWAWQPRCLCLKWVSALTQDLCCCCWPVQTPAAENDSSQTTQSFTLTRSESLLISMNLWSGCCIPNELDKPEIQVNMLQQTQICPLINNNHVVGHTGFNSDFKLCFRPCLFACLFLCQQDYSKTTEQISTEHCFITFFDIVR